MKEFADSKQMAVAAAVIAEEKKGKDITVIDFTGKSVLYDYIIITSALTKIETRAIAEAIDLYFKDFDTKRRIVQGTDSGVWILLDYGSIVVHIFAEQDKDMMLRGLRPVTSDRVDTNYRTFYALEELWSDIPRLDFSSLSEAEEFRKSLGASHGRDLTGD